MHTRPHCKLAAGGTVICAWAVFWAFLVFYALSRLGRLRVDQATELAGIDNIEHGGPAYPGELPCCALPTALACTKAVWRRGHVQGDVVGCSEACLAVRHAIHLICTGVLISPCHPGTVHLVCRVYNYHESQPREPRLSTREMATPVEMLRVSFLKPPSCS
jgi:hypothetical protein